MSTGKATALSAEMDSLGTKGSTGSAVERVLDGCRDDPPAAAPPADLAPVSDPDAVPGGGSLASAGAPSTTSSANAARRAG